MAVINAISIEVWTPSSPEVTLTAVSSDGNGIQTGLESRLTVESRTVNGSLVINGLSNQPLVLNVANIQGRDSVGDLDEIRLFQNAGEQANFRYNGYVSTNDLGMNRVGVGAMQTWGTSVRQRFEAPCMIVFGVEWNRLAGVLSNVNQESFELSLSVEEIP